MTKTLDIERWAEIVIKEWLVQIQNLEIVNTFALADSFTHMAYKNANGDVSKVMFLFNYYGKFAEMGVGRSISYDWATSTANKRSLKPWYTKTFHAQVHRLRELLQEKYKNEVQNLITATIKEEVVDNNKIVRGMANVGILE